MFESATFDSRGAIPTHTSRWMGFAFALNVAIVATVIVVPLLYPSVLPSRIPTQLLYVPSARPANPAQPRTQTAQSASHQPDFRTMPVDLQTLIMSHRPIDGGASSSDSDTTGPYFAEPTPGGSGVRPTFDTPTQTMKPTTPSVVHVSQGVLDGILIHKTIPVYPVIARTTGTSGTVTLAATVSKTGVIESLRVISGPAMLRQAAFDAVQTWRYKPYLLNNEPVEVETTINVVFSMAGH